MEFDLSALQQAFALVDLISRPAANKPSGFLEQLLLKKEQIKLKIYQEKGHKRPHFHVDYGRNNHVAAYAIDTWERIEGSLDKKYDKAVSDWAIANHESLRAVWQALQSGEPESHFIQSLSVLH
ncbi:DUF4160 domain-containing protein [Cupriavidus sp. amp6]|uniref:DUF4160 domain-containing protein n=1 Tax=Cupriavidus sp. amp6 TaxID=388051 RepID=UPI001E344A1D|nr:DUF4160 domain-containing protein [Cupriavidus sp. amp6]